MNVFGLATVTYRKTAAKGYTQNAATLGWEQRPRRPDRTNWYKTHLGYVLLDDKIFLSFISSTSGIGSAYQSAHRVA